MKFKIGDKVQIHVITDKILLKGHNNLGSYWNNKKGIIKRIEDDWYIIKIEGQSSLVPCLEIELISLNVPWKNKIILGSQDL